MKTNTKIVATIGPASAQKSTLKQMMQAGMNIARLNFSHGTYENHQQLIHTIRDAAKETKSTVALLQDIQGPRIRVGVLPKNGVSVKQSEAVILVSQKEYDQAATAGGYALDQKTNAYLIPIQYEKLSQFVKPKGLVYIQDGLIELTVTKVQGKRISCKVTQGGNIQTHKGMNAPGALIKTPILTPKDKKDIAFGVKAGVDYIALSFVQSANHIKQVRKLLPRSAEIKVIAKIEQAQAITNFDSILEEVDGVMIARGDLGVELGSAAVPVLQKQLIAKCVQAGKPVIVATQMLESMIQNPRPTRAEAADVANAVIDHADALMLSAETATGHYPVKTVAMMSEIVQNVEASDYDRVDESTFPLTTAVPSQSIAHAAVRVAATLQAKAIVIVSATGRTARYVSQMRPENTLLIAAHSNLQQLRQMQLLWGVEPMQVKSMDVEMIKSMIVEQLKKQKRLKKGDHVVVVTGFHLRSQAAVVEALEI